MFVCIFVLTQIYGETHWVPDGQMAKMALFIVAIFGGIASEFRRSWRDWRFWLALSGLFVLHVNAWAGLWRQGVDWRAIHYAVLAFVEIAVLVVTLDWLGFHPGSIVGRRRHSPRDE